MVKEFKKFLKYKEKDDFESFSIFEIIPLDTYNDNSRNNITTKIYDYKQFINIDNE